MLVHDAMSAEDKACRRAVVLHYHLEGGGEGAYGALRRGDGVGADVGVTWTR